MRSLVNSDFIIYFCYFTIFSLTFHYLCTLTCVISFADEMSGMPKMMAMKRGEMRLFSKCCNEEHTDKRHKKNLNQKRLVLGNNGRLTISSTSTHIGLFPLQIEIIFGHQCPKTMK